jgi:hypothetical protein
LNIEIASFTSADRTAFASGLSGTVAQPANTIAKHKPNTVIFAFIYDSFPDFIELF